MHRVIPRSHPRGLRLIVSLRVLPRWHAEPLAARFMSPSRHACRPAGLPGDLQPCRTLAPGAGTALKPLPTIALLALALAFGMVSHDDALARHVACRATDVMRAGSCYW